MTIGQAYSEVLTPREQQALLQACDWLIDHAFDEFASINEPKDVLETVLGSHLPERYTYRYTPLFYKKFAVCLMTVAWKLAQPEHHPLSSLAEELAAHAIIREAMARLEMEEEEEDAEGKGDQEQTHEPLDAFLDAYFEDMDVEILFEDRYDGLDETEIAKVLGMSSLAFGDWFLPFSEEPSRVAHPYVL